jgi:O-acetylhomoserine (thiol)-lyase
VSDGQHPETRVRHIGLSRDDPFGAVVPPIYQTTAFEFASFDEAQALFGLRRLGPLYGRNTNPTTEVLENRIAVVEGAQHALAFSSGKAAILATVLNLAGCGDNIVASSALYGGTYALFTTTLPRMGIEVRLVDAGRPDAFLAAADARTRLFYGETVSNPLLHRFPIAEVAARGRVLGIPTVIDNTLAPAICQPLGLGAAVTVLSCSKFVGGHGAHLGGVLAEGRFPWQAQGARFPQFVEPDASYGGLRWSEVAARHGLSPFVLRARMVVLRDLGSTLAPASAASLMMGLETLHLRMARHSETAQCLAGQIRQHRAAAQVFYPEVEPGARLPVLMAGGGLIGVDLCGGLQAGRRFIDALQVFRHVANNGDCRSLAIHPASTMLAQVGTQGQRELGVPPGFVRLSVGLEHPDDLARDIAQALQASLP